MSNSENLLLVIPRGEKGEELRVSLSEFKGTTTLNIREWYKAGEDMRPSKKGINIREEEFADFVRAVYKADETGFGRPEGKGESQEPATNSNGDEDDTDIPAF